MNKYDKQQHLVVWILLLIPLLFLFSCCTNKYRRIDSEIIMSKFTKWLVDNEYTTSEDKETIEGELSGSEADILYEQFLNEEGEDDE